VDRPVTVILAERSVFEVPQMMRSANDWGGWEGEIVLRNRSGKPLRARASLTPLSARDNRAAGYLLISALNQQAAGGEGNASLGAVAASLREIAHELNNPLAVMMGFTQLILLDLRCDGKLRADVERLYAEMKRIVQVVEKLHAYAVSMQDEQPELEQTRKTS
jgi:signal transduction histidine kinase